MANYCRAVTKSLRGTSRNQGFSYYFCLLIEGSGYVPLTTVTRLPLTNGSGSGSRRPQNIKIRIRNTGHNRQFRIRIGQKCSHPQTLTKRFELSPSCSTCWRCWGGWRPTAGYGGRAAGAWRSWCGPAPPSPPSPSPLTPASPSGTASLPTLPSPAWRYATPTHPPCPSSSVRATFVHPHAPSTTVSPFFQFNALLITSTYLQCCGSMKFRYGYGSGSIWLKDPDPYLWLKDPDPYLWLKDLDPVIFVSGLPDVMKNKFFLLITFWRYIYISRNQCFTYIFCVVEESGSIPLTNGSGSGRTEKYGSYGSGSVTLPIFKIRYRRYRLKLFISSHIIKSSRIRESYSWRTVIYFFPFSSVPDPDPHVFGPPGSVSVSTSQRYGSGSGSFYHHAKIVRKTLIPSVLWLFLTFYLWKMMQMYLLKVISRKNCVKN